MKHPAGPIRTADGGRKRLTCSFGILQTSLILHATKSRRKKSNK